MAKPPQSSEKPLLLVDIDGVISLFGFASDRRPAGRWVNVDGTLHFLSATAGEHLLSLARDYELVWCSGWEDRANDHLPYALGLPSALPFLTFDRSMGGPISRAHWKLAAIDAHAGDRALAWVDDAFNDACHAWAHRRAAPTLLVPTDPATGLTEAHVAELTRWGRALSAAGASAGR
jgi:HAD domain in Swiss Army Knife RNA repair proteins